MDNVHSGSEYSEFTPNLVLKTFRQGRRDRTNYSQTNNAYYEKPHRHQFSDFSSTRKPSVVEKLIYKFKQKQKDSGREQVQGSIQVKLNDEDNYN